MTVNVEKSVKASVRKLAKEQNIHVADLWQIIVLERFLARISQSEFKERFIFKGGMLLANYMQLDRETRDLDFLGVRVGNDPQVLVEIFQKISQIDLGDSFYYSDISVDVLSHPNVKYQGTRVKLRAHFGKIRFSVSIDVGFGDIVNSSMRRVVLSGFESKYIPKAEINLKCYPPEFIFAEKFHAISHLKGINSRMKDYYDLYVMIFETNFLKKEMIFPILEKVFARRNTRLDIPLKFEESEIHNLQNHWIRFYYHLRNDVIEEKSIPKMIKNIMISINEWLES